jgi:uncharacterized membrane protein YdjX (TVP38/TMEM64 family)
MPHSAIASAAHEAVSLARPHAVQQVRARAADWPLPSAAKADGLRPERAGAVGLIEDRRQKLVSLALRLLPLALMVGLGAAAVTLAGGPRQAFDQVAAQRAWFEAVVASHGVLAPMAYILCYAALMTLIWIPASMVTVIGGFLFGFWLGALCSLAGATLGATAVFLLARRGLVGLVRLAGPYVQRLEAGFRADALSYVLGLRLLPVVPFAVVTVVAAALGVSLRVFIVGTVLGIIPSTMIYAGLGNGLREATLDGAALDGALLLRPGLLLPLLGLAALIIAPVIWRRWRRS